MDKFFYLCITGGGVLPGDKHDSKEVYLSVGNETILFIQSSLKHLKRLKDLKIQRLKDLNLLA